MMIAPTLHLLPLLLLLLATILTTVEALAIPFPMMEAQVDKSGGIRLFTQHPS